MVMHEWGKRVLVEAEPLAEASSGFADYGRGIRAATRALWAGAIDLDQFIDQMFSAIRRGITRAWHEGAAECGIQPDELTAEERAELERVITGELLYVLGFGIAIEDNSKQAGGKLGGLLARADTWINRYPDAVNRAKLMACADKKLKWTIDPAKENCATCLKLNGKVKRASYWQRVGVQPQSPPNEKLDCKGWKCGCSLQPTSDPVSRGPLPNLP